MANLRIRDLVKTYDKTQVLHAIDLDIEDGEFVVLVGPSGCGKSTTLRLIAGLEEVTSGTIEIGGRQVNNLEPKDRDIANISRWKKITIKTAIALRPSISGL